MKTPLLTLSLMAATVLAGAASAQTVAQPAHPDMDVSDFHGTADTLLDALGGIESRSGGKVLEIRYAPIDGIPGFSDVVLKEGEVTFLHMARQDGLVTLSATQRPAWMMSWTTRADLRAANHAPVSLADAIRKAGKADDDAPAVAAGISPTAGDPGAAVHAYNVLLAENGHVHGLSVDTETGELIANPGALAQSP